MSCKFSTTTDGFYNEFELFGIEIEGTININIIHIELVIILKMENRT